jgi:hypothetical protein
MVKLAHWPELVEEAADDNVRTRPSHRSLVSGAKMRAAAGLSAVSWLVLPGFGLIDLSVTWSSDWPQVLEAGWGLFSTAVVGAAFVVVAFRPRWAKVASSQLAIAAGALAISAAAAQESRLLWFAGGLALQTLLVVLLTRPLREQVDAAHRRTGASRPLVALALLAVTVRSGRIAAARGSYT